MENSLRAQVRYVNFGQPSDAQSYLTAARRLCSGVHALAKGASATGFACSILAALALECALKAHLSSIGFTVNRLSHDPLDSDLENLWIEAATRGLDIPPRPPQWCSQLNEEHRVEVPLRHATDLQGLESALLLVIARELAELVEAVAKVV